jgi:hypothetical protein
MDDARKVFLRRASGVAGPVVLIVRVLMGVIKDKNAVLLFPKPWVHCRIP